MTGDFNSDGDLDLAVGNVGSPSGGGVQILLGNGAGQFSAGALYPTAGARVAIGDFNADGKLAFATTTVNNTVNVFLGDGTGRFVQTGSSPAVGLQPNAIIAADFNADGKLDLAVLNHCGTDPYCYYAGSVSLLLGDGLGNFTLASTTSTGYHSTAFAAGDLDGDGFLDVVVVNNEGFGTTVTVLLNDGVGHFNVASSLPTDLRPTFNSAAMADFNGDGKLAFTTGFVYLQAPLGFVNSVSPSSGSGRRQIFSAVYSDGFTINRNRSAFGAHYLTTVEFLMNTSSVAAGGCYVVFQQYVGQEQSYRLYLYDDAYRNLQGPITAGQSGTLSNSQCTLDGAASSASVLYNNLTLKLVLTFSGSFVGKQNIYLYSLDGSGQNTGWHQKGTWNP